MCVTAAECINVGYYLYVSEDETVRRCYPLYGCLWIGHRCVTEAECQSLGGYQASYSKCEMED